MATNYGKAWEQKIKEDFIKVPNATIDRLYDVTQGHKSITQPSDFIGFIGNKETHEGNIFYLEAKSCKGNTFPLTNLTQYQKLLPKVGIPGVRVGVALWFIEHDKALYVPVSTFKKLKEDGKKSVNIKMIDTNEYNIKVIPSIKKRVFLDCDFSILKDLEDGE